MEDVNELVVKEIHKREDNYYRTLYNIPINIVREFILKHKLIIYGGFALNELLPKKYKFYGDEGIPDFDVYIKNDSESERHLYDNPGNIIITKVQNFLMSLKKKIGTAQKKTKKVTGWDINLKLSAQLSALKETTIKIIMNEIDLLDLSIMSKSQFERNMYMYNMHKKDIRKNLSADFVINPIALKMALYYELGKLDSADRWGKLYKRMKLIDKHFYNAAYLNPNKFIFLNDKIDLKYKKNRLVIDLQLMSLREAKKNMVIVGGGYDYLIKNKHKLTTIFNIENYKKTTPLINYDIDLDLFILKDVFAGYTKQVMKFKIDLINKLNKYLTNKKSEYNIFIIEKERDLFIPLCMEIYIRKEDEMHMLFRFRYLDNGCMTFRFVNGQKHMNYFSNTQWMYLNLMNKYTNKEQRQYYWKLIYHMDKTIMSIKNVKDLFKIPCIGEFPVPVQAEEDL